MAKYLRRAVREHRPDSCARFLVRRTRPISLAAGRRRIAGLMSDLHAARRDAERLAQTRVLLIRELQELRDGAQHALMRLEQDR